MSSLPELADLETCCAKEILAPTLRAHDGQGRELDIQRAPTSRLVPLRGVPQQRFPTRAGSSKEGAYHLRLSEIGLAGVINALHFVYDR